MMKGKYLLLSLCCILVLSVSMVAAQDQITCDQERLKVGEVAHCVAHFESGQPGNKIEVSIQNGCTIADINTLLDDHRESSFTVEGTLANQLCSITADNPFYIIQGSPIEISKSLYVDPVNYIALDGPSSVKVGDEFTYTVTLMQLSDTNKGPVRVKEPQGLTFNINAGLVDVVGGLISRTDSNGAAQIKLKAKQLSTGSVNIFTVSTAGFDPATAQVSINEKATGAESPLAGRAKNLKIKINSYVFQLNALKQSAPAYSSQIDNIINSLNAVNTKIDSFASKNNLVISSFFFIPFVQAQQTPEEELAGMEKEVTNVGEDIKKLTEAISTSTQTQTTTPAAPTEPTVTVGGTPAQNTATADAQATAASADTKGWISTTKGRIENLSKRIEFLKTNINANKEEYTNKKYQPDKLLGLLDRNKAVLDKVISIIKEQNLACNTANAAWNCECDMKKWNSADCTTENGCATGKCKGLYSDMYCCASNDKIAGATTAAGAGTTGTKTAGTATSAFGTSVKAFITQCRNEGRGMNHTSLTLCCKNKCSASFPGKVSECGSYCDVYSVGGTIKETTSTSTTKGTTSTSDQGAQTIEEQWTACTKLYPATTKNKQTLKDCCNKRCQVAFKGKANLGQCVTYCSSQSAKITGDAISGFADEEEGEFQLLKGPEPEGTTNGAEGGKTTGTNQGTTIPEKSKVDPADVEKAISTITTNTQKAEANEAKIEGKKTATSGGAESRAQIEAVLTQVTENLDTIDKLLGVNSNSGTNPNAAPQAPLKPTLGCISVNWSGSKLAYTGTVWPRVNASMWLKYPLTCGYQLATGLYSIAQAASLIRGSGTCSEEIPIAGSDSCESCNMPYTICTADRCKILGTACRAINKDNGEGVVCLKGICTPTSIPVIDKMNVKFFVDRTKLWKGYNGQKVCPKAPPDVKALTNCLAVADKVPVNVSDVEINITLNQRAKCKYIIDKPGANFSEMSDFEDNQYYPTDQIARIDVTQLELGQNHTMYIKCEGTCGQEHNEGFDWNYIRFEFMPKPDEMPPIIVKVVPDPMTQYISSASINETVQVWLDEAGYCKYSQINETGCGANLTTNWSGMCAENQIAANVKSFRCNRNSEQCVSPMSAEGEQTAYNTSNCGRCYLDIDTTKGYEEFNWSGVIDGTEIPDITSKIPADTLESMKNLGMTGTGKVFTYMFRCADTESPENVMLEQNSYMYVIMTYPPFEMNITAPENNSDSFDREWTIKVNTTRPTECRYFASNTTLDWSNTRLRWENMTSVDEGMNTEHEGLTAELAPANYTLYIRCRDAGSLEQRGSVKFRVRLDNIAPIAIRLYKWEDFLYIETNELSDCVYGDDTGIGCKYNFSDGNELVGDMQYIHSAPWSLEHNYYVKCKDKWDNYPGGRTNSSICTTIISPYELPELVAA